MTTHIEDAASCTTAQAVVHLGARAVNVGEADPVRQTRFLGLVRPIRVKWQVPQVQSQAGPLKVRHRLLNIHYVFKQAAQRKAAAVAPHHHNRRSSAVAFCTGISSLGPETGGKKSNRC